MNSLEDIQWYEVSESSYYVNRFPTFFINKINKFLPSQIVSNEHSQVLYVVFAFQRNEFIRIMAEKFQIYLVV